MTEKIKLKNLTDKELNEIPIRAMTQAQFNSFKNISDKAKFSDYAKFAMSLTGYRLYLGDEEICKWEAWNISKIAHLIITGKTKITCVKKNSNYSNKSPLCAKEYIEACNSCKYRVFDMVSHPGGDSKVKVEKYRCELGYWMEDF